MIKILREVLAPYPVRLPVRQPDFVRLDRLMRDRETRTIVRDYRDKPTPRQGRT